MTEAPTLRPEAAPEATPKAAPGQEREFVAFRLADEDFCVDIMEIREIRSWTPPAALPHAPAWLAGLVNLRGAVLPVVDLARRLGLAARPADERSVVIVARVDGRQFGLVVDGVSDIIAAPAAAVQPTPDIGAAPEACIAGVIAAEARMLRLLDLRQVMPAPAGAAADAPAGAMPGAAM